MQTPSIYKSSAGYNQLMALYDAVLKNWPVPCETRTVSTRHGDTFVIASGSDSSPALVLLHGSCSNAVSWIGNVKDYSQFFRVYAVDIPGEPGRSAPNRPDWNSPAYAEWMEDLLDGLKIEKAALLGISQGGWTALKFATYRPERVNKLVLIATAGIVPARTSFILRAVLLSMLGKRGAEAINRITFGKEPVAEEAALYMNAIMTHFKPRIGKMNMYSDSELESLTMPVLLLGGELDPIQDNIKNAIRMKKLLSHVETKILPDKGHVLVNVSDIVLPFLNKLQET
jgi:pimeloyl-ACP methyl ester carboxylesterase